MKRVGSRRLALVLALAVVVALLVGWGVASHDGWSHPVPQPEVQESSGELAPEGPRASDSRSTDGGVSPSPDEGAGAVSREATGVGISSTDYRMDAGLADSATQVLEDYRDRGDCLLRQARYLDLLGKTWGCVIEGPTWVDIVIVQEKEGGSSKRVTRLDFQAWEAELKKLGP